MPAPARTANALLDAALAYAGRGWAVLPLHAVDAIGTCSCGDPKCGKSAGKHPRIATGREHGAGSTDPEVIRRWWGQWPDANVGVVTGVASGIVVLDVDPEAGGERSLEELERQFGELPITMQARTGSGGRHVLFAHPGGEIRIANKQGRGALRPGLDIRGDGGLIVAPPSLHYSGNRYAWWDDGGLAPADWLRRILQADQAQRERAEAPAAERTRGPVSLLDRVRRATAYLAAMPGAVSGQGGHDQTWAAALAMVRGFELPVDAAFDLMLTDYNPRCEPPWSEKELRHKVEGAAKDATVGYGYLLEAGQVVPFPGRGGAVAARGGAAAAVGQAGASGAPGAEGAPAGGAGQGEAPVVPMPAPRRPFTDYGNAERLVARLRGDFRYCPQWGCWMQWTGSRWVRDVDGEVMREAKAMARAIMEEARDLDDEAFQALLKHAARSERAVGLHNAVELAQSEPGIPVMPEDMDRDPWLLNCRNGTVDLRTQTLRPHCREDLLTRMALVDYDPEAKAPVWEAFLTRILQAVELVEYVRRAVGYSLTGQTSEQVLFVCYGTGANGKGTLLKAIANVMGDYAANADIASFMSSGPADAGRPRSDIARLKGRRFVVAQEADEGQRFSEGLVKALTGQDVITVRNPHETEFEFRPECKIWLAVNHRPVVRGTDHGIWRRIRLIPFEVTIPKEQWDLVLEDKLRAEASGILNWALAGTAAWSEGRLGTAKEVEGATEAYRSDMDVLATFLAERTVGDGSAAQSGLRVLAADLYRAYCEWCKEAGERECSQRTLGQRLRERGIEAVHTKKGQQWCGLGLRDTQHEEGR